MPPPTSSSSSSSSSSTSALPSPSSPRIIDSLLLHRHSSLPALHTFPPRRSPPPLLLSLHERATESPPPSASAPLSSASTLVNFNPAASPHTAAAWSWTAAHWSPPTQHHPPTSHLSYRPPSPATAASAAASFASSPSSSSSRRRPPTPTLPSPASAFFHHHHNRRAPGPTIPAPAAAAAPASPFADTHAALASAAAAARDLDLARALQCYRCGVRVDACRCATRKQRRLRRQSSYPDDGNDADDVEDDDGRDLQFALTDAQLPPLDAPAATHLAFWAVLFDALPSAPFQSPRRFSATSLLIHSECQPASHHPPQLPPLPDLLTTAGPALSAYWTRLRASPPRLTAFAALWNHLWNARALVAIGDDALAAVCAGRWYEVPVVGSVLLAHAAAVGLEDDLHVCDAKRWQWCHRFDQQDAALARLLRVLRAVDRAVLDGRSRAVAYTLVAPGTAVERMRGKEVFKGILRFP
ncbi:hypothetical protein DFJ73DRAFT_787216 [Zopfochytrium polystomum]|nr:hypothetical protein DFJ73DRAFT_787216 [Zopfochytrium polystomum]